MIPLRDTIPSKHWPVMTWLLIIFNLFVFLYQQSLDPLAYRFLNSEYGLIPLRFFGNGISSFQELTPFLSHLFLHAGWMHLIGNMWALWLFGDNVEDLMGSFRFLFFYICMGIVAGLVHILSEPALPIPTIGASGAIAGIMGAYFIRFPSSRIVTIIPLFFIPLFVEIPALLYLAFWLFSQVYSVLASRQLGTVSNIAWSAHIGGFVAGIFMHRLFFRVKRGRYRL